MVVTEGPGPGGIKGGGGRRGRVRGEGIVENKEIYSNVSGNQRNGM